MPELSVIQEFLQQGHLAVVGVSRDPKHFANGVYRHLRDSGRTMYPVNAQLPVDGLLEGDTAYRSLLHVPEPVDGVVVMVPREEISTVLDDAVARHVPRVWLHRGAGQPPVPSELVEFCRTHEMKVVDGACPLMFDEPVHGLHRLHRFFSGRQVAHS